MLNFLGVMSLSYIISSDSYNLIFEDIITLLRKLIPFLFFSLEIIEYFNKQFDIASMLVFLFGVFQRKYNDFT